MQNKILKLTNISLKDHSRFFDKVSKTNSCWLWIAAKDKDGYGLFSFKINGKKKQCRAHRVSYFIHRKNLPQKPLDHLCKQPSCVRPEHLESVSVTENNRRSDCPSGQNFRKTTCKFGHILTIRPSDPKRRHCKICRKAKRHEYHMKNYWKKGGREERHQRWLREGK